MLLFSLVPTPSLSTFQGMLLNSLILPYPNLIKSNKINLN